jgi:hypothetical protein
MTEIKSPLPGDGDHIRFARQSDSLFLPMGGNVAQIYPQVRFRLSKTQFAILAPAIEMIFENSRIRAATTSELFHHSLRPLQNLYRLTAPSLGATVSPTLAATTQHKAMKKP